jgi:UDP-2-acetamido-2-deoxy-ribo-hexuluronate aminotransferase
MDTLQAAILLEILEVFPNEVMKRQEIGERYNTGLTNLNGIDTPSIGEHNTSVHAQYTILSEQREEIQQSLKEKDIPSVSYYSVPLHLQLVFENLGHKKGDFPVAEKVANQCLSLPMSPYLNQNDQILVLKCVCNYEKSK